MSESPRKFKRVLIPAVGVVALLLVAGVVTTIVYGRGVGLAVAELGDGTAVTPSGVERVSITTAEVGGLDRVTVHVDGQPVEARRADGRMTLTGVKLAEGRHTLSVRAANPLPWMPDVEVQREFTVDATPPSLKVDAAEAESPRGPVTVKGGADGAQSVKVGDKTVPVRDGKFEASLDSVPDRVQVEATDAAGNAQRQEVAVKVTHPGMRAVHMSAAAWATASLRDPVLAMAREGRIDTVQLDIKDESGEIGYDSQVPLARQIGANRNYYDAKAVIDELHGLGLRVVGRLVAFRDPVLGKASWQSGARDRVAQNSSGAPWSAHYGEYAFTNFANPEVRDYNIAIAKEAASLGFDDILYDYVRRPDGPLGQMVFPGLATSPEQSIVEFLRDNRAAVRPLGAYLGASVFGIAAHSPGDVAQDIPAIAAHVDYVSPMVYPSHWGPGEYGVGNPNAQPYEIVRASVADFVGMTQGTGATVIPWLQAFSLGVAYGPGEVQAQVRASAEAGAPSFLLWNAACTYGSAGLEPA
ncbi:putative glycoside hydrolase [Actinosynnema sp. NPDC059335]|uniref:putative glycoside hydrolase n=1 Tax=Actinosynnema sp. NPDC059335 TaxID=3346804 RepID=UPI00366D7BC9